MHRNFSALQHRIFVLFFSILTLISPILHLAFTKPPGGPLKGPYLKHNEQSVEATPSGTWSDTNVD